MSLLRRLLAAEQAPKPDEVRRVSSPLTAEMLAKPGSASGLIQFNTPLSEHDLYRLGDWLRENPTYALRSYGPIEDLEFLRFFPFLTRFAVDNAWRTLTSLQGLRHLPSNVESLTIGWAKRKLDLSVLKQFTRLKTLYLEGQTKNIDVLSGLTTLEDLTLRSITLPDLSLLLPLDQLRSLDLKLGGTKDLSLLPRIGRLLYLEIWLVRGFSNLDPVSELSSLKCLFLQALKGVTRLPDLSRCISLRRIDLENMKGLRDLRPLLTAPALEDVSLVEMQHLRVEDVAPLAAMPRLRRANIGLGSLRKNAAAQALLNVPDLEGGCDWRSEDGADVLA